VNTALSTGVGEIIDVAMAKKREERYASTEDLLEDLRAVQRGQPPTHARRAVDLDSLAKIEETGKTVDIAPSGPTGPVDVWTSPAFITAAVAAGVSLLANVIMIVILLLKK
jgi:serine/threonine-protein kinase